jgi:hypothetical protein
MAAGAAALLWSACPALTNAQVRAFLEDTAVDLGEPFNEQGQGRVQVDAAIFAAQAGPDC